MIPRCRSRKSSYSDATYVPPKFPPVPPIRSFKPSCQSFLDSDTLFDGNDIIRLFWWVFFPFLSFFYLLFIFIFLIFICHIVVRLASFGIQTVLLLVSTSFFLNLFLR